MKHYFRKIDTPVGQLTLVANERALVALLWGKEKLRDYGVIEARPSEDHPVLGLAVHQLSEYFAAKRKSFDIPCEATGTRFQKNVWKALREIPYGEKRSYAEIARRVRSPKAFRAVGAAHGRNPISIIVPCHRVIGANGKLVGFGGGLKTKKFLLDLESRQP